ncbi:hypothetical protein O6H91_12G080800 [Diphasiastrum complanatum]|uniref:Uncharacterized protein n=1 Tax=Diphasiastrum complanatum TaxID=34168 RepID=A0ACC2C3Y2_DIPCM|nr:hypothetical protein O6H91_12G080800 [Diphasiastrum complanatum]
MGKAQAHDAGGMSAEDKKADQVSKRLRDLAIARGLLSRSQANPGAALKPSKVVLNCDGKDIVKRGQRKSKYLFAFPGLVAPVAGGKFGDLANLDSRNPILYVDFPQGRLKMFGTIVYPKNKYLTLHFSRGAGNITCEDAFESLVVFSEVRWIGSPDENPEELRLPLPRELEQVQEKHTNFSFAAGAGRSSNFHQDTDPKKQISEPKSPNLDPIQSQFDDSGHLSALNKGDTSTPAEETRRTSLRHSTRTAARNHIYAETSSDGDDSGSGSEDSDHHSNARNNSGGEADISNEKLAHKDAEQVSATNHPLSLDSDEEAKNGRSNSVSKFSIRSKDHSVEKVAEVLVTATPVSLTSDSEATRGTASPRDDLESPEHKTQKPCAETGPEVKRKGVGRTSKSSEKAAQDSLPGKPSKQKLSKRKEDFTGIGGSAKKQRISSPPANSRKKPERRGAVKQRDEKKVTRVLSSQESARKRNSGRQKSHLLDENLDKSDGGTSDDQEMNDSSDKDFVA